MSAPVGQYRFRLDMTVVCEASKLTEGPDAWATAEQLDLDTYAREHDAPEPVEIDEPTDWKARC